MPNSNPALNLRQQKEQGETTDWFEVLPTLAATAATRTSGQFDNPGHNGMLLYIKIANTAGTPSLQPNLYMKDPNGAALLLWAATAALTGDGTVVYSLHPSDPSEWGSGITESSGVAVPRKWYFALTYTGTPATDKMDTEVYAAYI